MRVAVVGHIEWIEFGRVAAIPKAGEIAHATDAWEEPGGGGAVAAVQLAKLAGSCDLFTAVGDDEIGHRAAARLEQLGVRVHTAIRTEQPTRRAVTLIDPSGERTITTLGGRLQADGADPLPWELVIDADAAYVCAGDADAFRFARRARVMVVTSRALDLLAASGVRADVVVGSAHDPAERFDPDRLPAAPPIVVRTEGTDGGSYESANGSGRYEAATPPGPVVDTYGCGDSFAAGLAYSLGTGHTLQEALSFAARCGAACATGHGPYEGQLSPQGS